MMTGQLYAIGEALIDFVPNQTDLDLKDVQQFKRVMGGAPANVAVAVAKLGGKSQFVSKLGEDAFGDHIVEQLEQSQVGTTWVRRTKEANTGLAFVSLKKDGQRDFSFYRKPSADMLLSIEEVKDIMTNKDDIVHFCSVDLIDAPIKEAHRTLLDQAVRSNTLISFDPNVRLPLWESAEACKQAIDEFIPYAHLLKISDEELTFITGIEDEEEALESLFRGNVAWVIYTRGPKGALLKSKFGHHVEHHGFQVEAIDTTGAGDAFIGSFIYQMQKHRISLQQLPEVSSNKILEMLSFSNGYAALTTLKNGAVDALPPLEEVEAFITNNRP